MTEITLSEPYFRDPVAGTGYGRKFYSDAIDGSGSIEVTSLHTPILEVKFDDADSKPATVEGSQRQLVKIVGDRKAAKKVIEHFINEQDTDGRS